MILMRRQGALLIAVTLMLSGCAGRKKQLAEVRTARLYNLASGTATEFKYSYSGTGRGRILPIAIGDEQFTGEYVTLAAGRAEWGQIYSAVYGSGGTATGRASVSAVSQDLTQQGQAIITGDKGTLMQCEYLVNLSGPGLGACKDNHGTQYRMMF
jgi:hypothetical protein